uniref:Uncharacterized protein n=1 Tax=Plectus sambesii TaxID=2011161 RepID=A0A914UQK8_9BILA
MGSIEPNGEQEEGGAHPVSICPEEEDDRPAPCGNLVAGDYDGGRSSNSISSINLSDSINRGLWKRGDYYSSTTKRRRTITERILLRWRKQTVPVVCPRVLKQLRQE